MAAGFALDTLTRLEGATLWLALDGDTGPIEAAKAELLARADGYASEEPDDDTRSLLDQVVGDWRRASLTEKGLGARLVAGERKLSAVQATLEKEMKDGGTSLSIHRK